MAVPKKRRSLTRRNKTLANVRVDLPQLVQCSHCNNYRKPHCVCSVCGRYKGHKI